jgi:hypothetical protein
MASVQKIRIYSPLDCSDREAELHQRVSVDQLDWIESNWRPILDRQAQHAKLAAKLSGRTSDPEWQGVLNQYGCPDALWDWPNLANPSGLGLSKESFCIESGGEIQCVMLVSLTERCRLKGQTNQHMVYVGYLAIAPWNRIQISQPIQLQGLGTILLGVAVNMSRDEGWYGRVGLHSLLQSEGFYTKKGMTSLGADSAKNDLTYYEFTEDAASTFLP